MYGFLLIFLMVVSVSFNSPTEPEYSYKQQLKDTVYTSDTRSLYDSIGLDSILKYEAFEHAMKGYNMLPIQNKNILTIIDFSLPSTAKRLYVLDIKNKLLLFHSIVSHGKNSGENYATSFSNQMSSYKSSLGFYLTENTYQGGNGYSLVLNGLEKGINDQAKARAIVMHGATYCNEKVIPSLGRLGRSYGCPALPVELNKPIINTIKNGTLLYIHGNNKEYISKSHILNEKNLMNNQQQVSSL